MQRVKNLGIVLFCIIITSLFTSAEDSFYNDEAFFNALRTCDEYTYTTKLIKSDYTREFHKSINKNGTMCEVVLRQNSTQHSTSANSYDVEAYLFPLDVVKDINKYNFDRFAAKYIVNE